MRPPRIAADGLQARVHVQLVTRVIARRSYSIECETPEHVEVVQLAWLGICLYPVGVPLLYAGLLIRAREAILMDTPTPLRKALNFLVGSFRAWGTSNRPNACVPCK